MSRKVYKSAQGKTVDLGALQLQNETVKAVGNMGVNARGDRVSATNTTVESRTQTVNRQYKKQINRTNVRDDAVVDSKRAAQKVAKQKNSKQKVPKSTPVEDLGFDQPSDQTQPTESISEVEVAPQKIEQPSDPAPAVVKKAEKTVGGLADAIAKAKSVKQEPLKTPRQQAQEKKGVKRI